MKEFLYKYGLIIFLMVALSIMAFQKEAKVTNDVVPNQTVVISALTPVGPLPLIIKKGLLNPENEGKTWMTFENFKKKSANRRRPKIDNRHTFEARK